ncbi:MAG: type II toxin-antitoxin system RelE/ParE family toxin [Patescibacteria group bacterium]
MPKWSVEFTSEAEKDISLLDKSVQKRIVDKLDWLESNFSEVLPTVLTADFRDYFKLRVGDWRIFYQVDWYRNIITIRYIDHRSKAYKKSKK